jgi:hypothetical protein
LIAEALRAWMLAPLRRASLLRTAAGADARDRHPGESRDPFCFSPMLEKINMDSAFRRNDDRKHQNGFRLSPE